MNTAKTRRKANPVFGRNLAWQVSCSVVLVLFLQFLANVNYVTFAICYRRSVCHLSVVCLSVTLVRPTQPVEPLTLTFQNLISLSPVAKGMTDELW